MAKKNKSKQDHVAGNKIVLKAPSNIIVKAGPKKKKSTIVKDWDEYFGPGDLTDWRRLMTDLGIEGEFASKRQCRKALAGIWVNIRDFLDAIKEGEEVHHFKTELELSRYTLSEDKIYPKRQIPTGSPLRKLLANIIAPKSWNRANKNAAVVDITRLVSSLSIG